MRFLSSPDGCKPSDTGVFGSRRTVVRFRPCVLGLLGFRSSGEDGLRSASAREPAHTLNPPIRVPAHGATSVCGSGGGMPPDAGDLLVLLGAAAPVPAVASPRSRRQRSDSAAVRSE